MGALIKVVCEDLTTVISAPCGNGTLSLSVTGGSVWSLSAVAVLTRAPLSTSVWVMVYEPVQVSDEFGARVGIGLPLGQVIGVTRGSVTDILVNVILPVLLAYNSA